MLPSRIPNRFAPGVEPRTQVLHYRIPVVGTGMSLNYASDRVPGRIAANQLRIPLKPARLPHDVEEIALEVTVDGQQFTKRFPATEPSYTYTWETPARTVSGSLPLVRSQAANVRVGYVHRAIWPRPERIDWREHKIALGVWDARRQGLGGWTLTPHHALDAVAGIMYLGDGSRRQIGAVAASSTAGWRIASEDASEIYEFDADGRHRRTLDTFTGGERLVFADDADGRLHTAGPPDAELCRVERSGEEVALLAPGSTRTTLALDESGYLRSVVDPSGGRIEVRHGPDGLLHEVVDPRGNAYRFVHDDLGRLTSEERPDGGGSVLRRTATASGFTVHRSTATGVEFVDGLERLPGGVTRRVTGCCVGGGQMTSLEQPDGGLGLSFPDGSTLELEEQPDPRFGMAAPLLKRLIRTTPSGLTGQVIVDRAAAAREGDATALATQTDTLALNGRLFLVHLDAGTRRVTHTSAAGRIATASFDVRGDLTGAESQGFAPLMVQRDAAGRFVGAASGSRQVAVRRDQRGRPVEVEFSPGRVMRMDFDEAERVVKSVGPGSRRRAYEYDAAGNMTTLTTPSGAAHRFEYGPVNRWTAYRLPTGERYEAACDADGRPALSRLPSGREVRREYDEVGRLRAIRSPEADVAFQIDTAGRLTSAVRTPTDDGGAQEVNFAYDGPLVTSGDWRGPATASVRYTYDADFRVASIRLDGRGERRLARDVDGLITAIGPFSVQCDGPGGAASAINDGRMAIIFEFDSSGRVVGRVHQVAGREFYRLHLARGAGLGVQGREEMIDGTTIARSYSHDADGQLVAVEVNGSTRERYGYDANGNRVHQESQGGAVSASFDAGDRLLSLGAVAREMDGDGHLRRRGNQTFSYGARGELLRVLTGDASSVQYTYDGLGRVVARTDASGTAQYIYNHLAPFPELLASRSPNGALTEYYFDNGGDLFALERDGAWFYVACDEVGSPRVVVDADGHVVKAIELDAFGVEVTDSNPSFDLCIGFAGGLVDPVTQLVRFGRRDYEPGAGRWTAPDPAGFHDGSNLYRYVWNNPVSFRDPSGTQGSGSPIWRQPFHHVSPEDPVFHPEPTPVDDPAFPFDTGPQQWDHPRTDTFPIAPPTPSIFEKLAGSEPRPGGEYWDPGWDWRSSPQNIAGRGAWCEWQVGVGGIGESGSPYSPMFPGSEPGSPEPAPGDGGVSWGIRF